MSSWIQKVVHRREVVGGLGLSALFLLFPSLAMAAAGPTLKASKVGQKVVWRGYVYTVVKSKGKLVWKQGAKVAVATAKATASATPKPSATASATPTPSASATPTPSASVTPTPSPTPSPSDSATPTPSPTATPTQTPSPTPSPTSSFGVFAANSSEIKEGQIKIIEINTIRNQYTSYSFSRLGGKVYAVSIICTHSGCKVVAEKTELVCNCHLSIFSPFDGAAQSGPARLPLTRYEVTERDGKIYIKP
jgi:nitrite reductase/ring-hydroxylating ferredoxin subunit